MEDQLRLTEGALPQMATTDDMVKDMVNPILQVVDLKRHQQRGGAGPESERFRLVLSDGSGSQQQAMLATQLNSLVGTGRLQVGSVICLNQFTCTRVQQRTIIIIVSLDVLVEKCDIIGASGIVPQSLHGSAHHETMTAEQPRFNQSSGGSYSGIAVPGRYATDSGSGFPASGSYAAQNTGLRSPLSQVSPPLQNSYVHPPQPTNQPNPYAHSPRSTYQQPLPSYARPLQPPSQQQPPSTSYARPPQQQAHPLYNRAPAAKNEVAGRIMQIRALNQYQNKWTVKGRVTAKSELRSFRNARGEGTVFNFDVIDSDGEIRVTCFNSVAEEFYSLIEVGRLYLISKGTVKPAVKKFNHLNNEFEIQLDTSSVIQKCFDDDGSIPMQHFNFRPLSDVEGLENNIIVDTIGVVSSISPAASIMTRNGEGQKRTLQLKDMSCRSIEVTLWGNLCNAEGQELQCMCDSGLFPVLAVKAGRVHDFNGKRLSTTATSQLVIEPKGPEADGVRKWFKREGRSSPCVSISRETARNDIRKTISQIKDERLGTSEKPDWITVSATVVLLKGDNYFYPACPLMNGDRQCNKKVTNDGDGTWKCDRCDQSVQHCDYRYILNLQIQDHTGIAWVTAFQEIGEEMMGINAKELHHLKHEMQDENKVAEIIQRLLFTEFLFKLKVKEETYSDEQRVKSTIVKAEKVNASSKGRFCLDLMSKLKNGESTTSCAGLDNIGVGSSAIRQHTPAAGAGHSTNPADASREFGAPAYQVGYVGSQYHSPRVPSTGSTGSYLSCNICGGTTHNSLNCPNIMHVQGQSSGGGYTNSRPAASNSGECYKCQQPGHWARDCPGSNHIPAYGNSGVQPGRYGGVSSQRVSY